MGIMKPEKVNERVDEALTSYHESIDGAFDKFITGLIEVGEMRGVSRLELLRSVTNVLNEAGWSVNDIQYVLECVKEKMDSIHYN